jgi:membrane associated rhomboid family serine protease
VVAALIGMLWAVYVVQVLTGAWLLRTLAIEPRTLAGLDGVVFAPLLHGSVAHLLNNTVPLAVFGFLTFLEGARKFAVTVAGSWLVSGLGVWVFGAGRTIGISGVVFGLFAYLVVRGFYNRNWKQILLAVVLFLSYGSILWGALPLVAANISWQGHLFGVLGGVLSAVVMRKRPTPHRDGPPRTVRRN